MDRLLFKAKMLALSIHVLASLLLVLMGLGLLSLWFPSFLFRADGGLQVFWLLLGVDLVLGPLLTFVVYNPTKSFKERCVDLSVIALLQLSAFSYGMYQAWQQRPMALVVVDGSVMSCSHRWYELAEMKPPSSHNVMSLLALTPNPTGEQADARVMMAFAVGVGECVLTNQYTNVAAVKPDLVKARPELMKKLPQALQPTIAADALLVPFEGRYQSVMLVLDPQMQIIDSHILPKP